MSRAIGPYTKLVPSDIADAKAIAKSLVCYTCGHPAFGHVGNKHECRYETECDCQEFEHAPKAAGVESIQDGCESADIGLDTIEYCEEETEC